MENQAIRAIFIGVSLFVIMITLSLVLTYLNTAKSLADSVSDRVDIAETTKDYSYYVDIIESEREEEYNEYIKLNGVEIRSLLRKFAGDEKMHIKIKVKEKTYSDVNTTLPWYDTTTGLLNEAMLSHFNPVSNYDVEILLNQNDEKGDNHIYITVE